MVFTSIHILMIRIKNKFGAYVGLISASLYYFNVSIRHPGAEPEINLADLQAQLSILKVENDSLKDSHFKQNMEEMMMPLFRLFKY